MSVPFIPITRLPGPPPLEIVISADELAHYYTAQRIIANANEKSAHILAELEQQMAMTRSDLRRIREQARQTGLSEAKAELDSLRAETIAQAVEWLIAEDELERQIANNLDERIRSLLTQTLASWIDERNVVDDVMRRVKQSLEKMAGEELATLYVASEVEDVVREQLGTLPRVSICTDATLSEGQARLESRLILIRFDLDAHHHLILERLSRAR